MVGLVGIICQKTTTMIMSVNIVWTKNLVSWVSCDHLLNLWVFKVESMVGLVGIICQKQQWLGQLM